MLPTDIVREVGIFETLDLIDQGWTTLVWDRAQEALEAMAAPLAAGYDLVVSRQGGYKVLVSPEPIEESPFLPEEAFAAQCEAFDQREHMVF